MLYASLLMCRHVLSYIFTIWIPLFNCRLTCFNSEAATKVSFSHFYPQFHFINSVDAVVLNLSRTATPYERPNMTKDPIPKFSIQAYAMQLRTRNSKTSIIKNNINLATPRLIGKRNGICDDVAIAQYHSKWRMHQDRSVTLYSFSCSR